MKARVKATGEIVEVTKGYDLRKSTVVEFYTNIEDPTDVFEKEDLEFSYDSEFIDYWTRLEHQYAGMAMQAMLTSPELMQVVTSAEKLLTKGYAEKVAIVADKYAHALVEKMKEADR